MNPLLKVRQLSKSFAVERGWLRREAGRVAALSDVSFDLNPGESLGLVGESGSGKTTLARIVAGFLPPEAGEMWWDGRPLALLSRAERAARAQMIFQDPAASLNPKLSVRTLVGEALRQRARWDRRAVPGGRALDRAVAEALDAVGLPADSAAQYPHQFSGGQRQRVAIARALAARPKLLIADEPVSALDLSVQAQILNLLADLREKFQLTMILISHDLTVVRHMTDKMMVLEGGRVAEAGSTPAVLARPQSPVTQALLDAVPALLR